MKPGTIFISHRAEYGTLVRELKTAIEATSRRKIKVFISEDLPPAKMWRPAIKSHLRDAESLFLIYGAPYPYEDWSWCFYEAGFFAGVDAAGKKSREIYCLARPDVTPPGPLSDLQIVTDPDKLIAALIEIYARNKIAYDGTELRANINQATTGLFRKLKEFRNYPRVHFVANESDVGTDSELPSSAVLKGDTLLLGQLFGVSRDAVAWNEIILADAVNRTPQEQMFFSKWIDETKRIILAARNNKIITPQTVLIARGGPRYRFLLYQARLQGDGSYCCEFLVIDEVGGPALGLSQQQLALLTSIRLGFRFRYELIEHFTSQFSELSDEQREARIREIPRIIDTLMTESYTRGNPTPQDLQSAFEGNDAARIGTLLGYWPILKDNLYDALGLSADGKRVSDQGLVGANLDRYRIAFDSLRLLNIEFLYLCCARVSQMMTRSDDELQRNAEVLENNVRMLSQAQTRTAA